MFEKEIEHYLYIFKSELKLNIDNIYRELGDNKYHSSELNLVKQNVNDNKKLILIFQEDFEKKISDINMKVNYSKPNIDEFMKKLNVLFK